MFFHETGMKTFGSPHINRRVLAFLVGAKKRLVPDKPGVLLGLARPHPAIFNINRDTLLVDLKKHHVDEH